MAADLPRVESKVAAPEIQRILLAIAQVQTSHCSVQAVDKSQNRCLRVAACGAPIGKGLVSDRCIETGKDIRSSTDVVAGGHMRPG